MKLIKLDASNWSRPLDFYKAILPAIGAPDWHGASVDALTESMVWGEINSLEPPYIVQIYSTKDLPSDVIQQLNWAQEGLATQRSAFRAQNGHDVEVELEIVA